MISSYKPANYNSLSPYLIVNDARRLAALLKGIFKATEQRKIEREDGSILHLELLIDDSILMIADATADYPPQSIMLHLYLPNVDEVYQMAIAAGCEGIDPPKVQDGDVDKRGMFTDFAGNFWSISTQQQQD